MIEYCQHHNASKVVIILPTHKESYIENNGSITIYHDNNLALSKSGSSKETSKRSQFFAELVKEIIDAHKIDIICAENFHIGLPPSYSLLLNMVAGLNKIPLVLRLHSFASTDLQTELINQLMWDKISCVSKSVTGDCFHRGADINNLSTDYLGVNTEKFNNNIESNLKESLNLSSKSKIVITATRIILGRKNILEQKGIINLIQAFSKISPKYPDLYLLIAMAKCPEPLKVEFEQAKEMLLGYIKLHNIEKNTILKMFELDEMPSVYKGSDVFVLASENETFGQVFIESMACGLPVIGTNVGGIPEIISDSNNGILVSPNDSSALAQSIETLLFDKETKDKFVSAGLKIVENKFKSEKQFENFFHLLRSVATSSV